MSRIKMTRGEFFKLLGFAAMGATFGFLFGFNRINDRAKGQEGAVVSNTTTTTNSASNKTWLQINSFEELMQHEKEILEHIRAVPNGGNLFMINPFMLFADIGVLLSDKAKAEIIETEPFLASVSATPYNALKTAKEKQTIVIELQGLFKRDQIESPSRF